MLTGFLPNSLTFPGFSQPEMNYSVHTFFLSLNSRSFKEIQGEKLHNFSEIFLMMYHSSTPLPPPPPPSPLKKRKKRLTLPKNPQKGEIEKLLKSRGGLKKGGDSVGKG